MDSTTARTPVLPAAPGASPRRDDSVRSIEKAIAILDCFSARDRKLSVAIIAKQTGIPRGTAHRISSRAGDAGRRESLLPLTVKAGRCEMPRNE